MKPPPFEYRSPETLSEAVTLLQEHGGDARLLAGGQSLIPMLNFRLASPAMLVDLQRVPEAGQLSVGKTVLSVGAMTRTGRLLGGDVAKICPALAEAVHHVAHPQIRSRGTVGGSLSNADPAAELPAVAQLLDAKLYLHGPRGERMVPATEYFLGVYETACEWDEILIRIEFPAMQAGAGWGFREFARRPGDFAIAGVGAVISLADNSVERASLVAFGLGPNSVRLPETEDRLRGWESGMDMANIRTVFEQELEVDPSPFNSEAYKRRIAGFLFEQTIQDAVQRATVASA